MMNDVYEKFLKVQKSLFLQKTSRKNLILFLSLEMVIRRWQKKQQNCLRRDGGLDSAQWKIQRSKWKVFRRS